MRASVAKITVDEMTGGTFTISNGGVFGSMLSTPIIKLIGGDLNKTFPVIAATHATLDDIKKEASRHGEIVRNGFKGVKVGLSERSGGLGIEVEKDVNHEYIKDNTEKKQMFNFGVHSGDKVKLDSMMSVASTLQEFATTADGWDQDELLFQCNNGILVLTDGSFIEGKPDYMISQCSGVNYDPNAECPVFDQFLIDIMDGDDTRHNQPSVHKKWDESTAILSGDALFALSQLLLTDLDTTVHQRFNEVALTVCEGQGFDKEFENNPSIKMDQYLLMISKKTGALLGLSSEIGGMIGGLNDKENNHLFEFGLNLGLAFQIQDDYLEIFADETTMGKSLGSDIHYQKQTAMTILAREKDLSGWNQFINKKNDIEAFRLSLIHI